MESCKEKWKDEGNPGITVTLTGVKEVIEIGASVGATPAGTARVSSCNEASLVVFQSCREGLRQSGCANECFAESFSGIQRKLSFYPPIHLPAGRPALAAVRAAQRQSAQEHGINELGHRLLDAGRVADAIVLFRWNAENFPGSANVYASLGAAHAKAGDLVPAIRNYQHALLLDPRKESARSALPELLKRVKSWPK
jgi:tetratricopeptide (TPR) repeat protein